MPQRASAFSLVELSIVLVILGLLTGGILAGQSLIRAAELRSVGTEYSRWVTATQAFRDKYFALPGDMRNATAFWGDDNTNCPDGAVANGTPGTCNGNGDGGLAPGSAAAGATGETFQYWKHLALAGLIEGTYTGLSGPAGAYDAVIGTNGPRSKLSSTGWSAYNLGIVPIGVTSIFEGDYSNIFMVGGQLAGSQTWGAVMKPEEAWNIDSKLDDGKPGRGRMVIAHWNDCTDAATNAALDSNYLLDSGVRDCSLVFLRAF